MIEFPIKAFGNYSKGLSEVTIKQLAVKQLAVSNYGSGHYISAFQLIKHILIINLKFKIFPVYIK